MTIEKLNEAVENAGVMHKTELLELVGQFKRYLDAAVVRPEHAGCTLRPVAYRIEQTLNPHVYWVQRMHLDGVAGPLWYVLLRLNDPAAYPGRLGKGHESPEAALAAWVEYASPDRTDGEES